jgi:hypothetical protein
VREALDDDFLRPEFLKELINVIIKPRVRVACCTRIRRQFGQVFR